MTKEEIIKAYKLNQKKRIWQRIMGCVKPVEKPFATGCMN
jgi:hypothetical protein